MSSNRLIIVANNVVVGELTANGHRVALEYDSAWRNTDDAYPISLSMPLSSAAHPHKVVEPYLWNLLPDNDRIIAGWAKRFQVSPRNAFALIVETGEDVAGALQFFKPERLTSVEQQKRSAIDWLTDQEIGERLADLLRDESAWSRSGDVGNFSLSGAQPKLALLSRDGRWGIPSGRMPTTHILKPPSDQFDGHAENEHFCLTLGGLIGLPVAHSEVRTFEGRIAIVVERFDRLWDGNKPIRVPLEDCCQALGIHPSSKYQKNGGPGPKDVARLLRAESSRPAEDLQTFADALIFNWLIGGTDAHAKNYSLLIGAGGRARLAPLYDIASALGYRSLDPKKMKSAMKIGSHYELNDITSRDWRTLAIDLQIDAEEMDARIRRLIAALPDAIATARRLLKQQQLKHPILDYMSGRIIEHLKSCAARVSISV